MYYTNRNISLQVLYTTPPSNVLSENAHQTMSKDSANYRSLNMEK